MNYELNRGGRVVKVAEIMALSFTSGGGYVIILLGIYAAKGVIV